jgi:hypothetical protein
MSRHLAATTRSAPVTIEVVAPVRTLVEKLCLVHDAACNAADGQPEKVARTGRHFYDIQRLLANQQVRPALEAPGIVPALTDDVHYCGSAFNASPAQRPERGYAASPAFDDDHPILRAVIERSYDDAMGLVWGDRPTFADCISIVHEAAAVL